MADSISLHQSVSLSPSPWSVTSSSSHSLLTYPSSSLPFQRRRCEVCSDQWIVLRVTKNCDKYTNPINKLCWEMHGSFNVTAGNENTDISWTTVGCIRHAVSVHQHTASFLSQLECPLCTQYMRPPITLYVNGYNICSICKQSSSLSNLKTAVLKHQKGALEKLAKVALEKLATEEKYPSTHWKFRCREIYSFNTICEQQEESQYILKVCPVNKVKLGTCIWTGISSKMESHLKQAHRSMCVDYYSLFQGPTHVIGVTPATRHCQFIFTYNDVFYSWYKIVNGIFYSVLHYIGPAADAVKYRYKVEFFNKECMKGLAVTLLVRSWDEDLGEARNSGNYVKLHPEQFNHFANGRSELALSMEILTVWNKYPQGQC